MALLPFIVLFKEADSLPADPPSAYACWADDADHAEEQCFDDSVGRNVVWVYKGHDVTSAFIAYYYSVYSVED